MNEANLYDVIIMSAGPIGIACALECNKNNLHYLVIEKGCLVNSLYNYPQNITFFSTPALFGELFSWLLISLAYCSCKGLKNTF
jgi:thioredoxin reductase